MKEIILSSYFVNFFIPLISTFLVVFVKIVTRNDNFTTIKKEDFAIGIDISVTALIILITDSVKMFATPVNVVINQQVLDEKKAFIPWLICAFLIGIWGISTIVRKLGWKNSDELNVFWGIVLPDVLGFSFLLFVVKWIGG